MENQKSTAKKVVTVIVNILIWVFIAFAVIVTILTFAAQSNSNGIPSIGGKTILTVQTSSMEPVIMQGDIIIGRKLTTKEQKTLKVGDVITFNAGDLTGDGVADINTHKIIEVNDKNGEISYVTKGENREVADETPVKSQDVICIYEGTRFAKLGRVLDYLSKPQGFLVVIVLPLVLFFLYELVAFVRKVIQVKTAGTKQITEADEELIRQKAVEEYIKAQKAAEEAPKETTETTEGQEG